MAEDSYNIPGGHFVHPSAPLVEELENVPSGHGNNTATNWLLRGINLNPVDLRAEISSELQENFSRSTRIASFGVSIEFLGEIIHCFPKWTKFTAKVFFSK